MAYIGIIHRLIFEGGAINWIIIAMYGLMLFVAAERLVYYALSSYSRRRVTQAVQSLKTGPESFFEFDWPKRFYFSAPFLMIQTFCEAGELDGHLLNEELDRCAFRIQRGLSTRLSVFSLLANVAPLCGLLGTVTGLMDAFDAIERQGGQADMASLAGGIWSAMITTATGLIVAIPSLIILRCFESVMSRRLEDASVVSSLLKQKFRPDCLADERL